LRCIAAARAAPAEHRFEAKIFRNFFTEAAQAAGMEKYKTYAEEAQQLAASALREPDRQFWLNIARAWLNLLESWRKR
jgi:hypothetical protein